MKNLTIKLIDKNTCEIFVNGRLYSRNKLPVDCWSIEDYQKQWEEGLQRIETHNESMLVIWVNKLNKNPDISYIVLYKVGNKIQIQEWGVSGVKDYKELSKELGPFNLENCYKYIELPYEPLDEGNPELTDYVLEDSIDI